MTAAIRKKNTTSELSGGIGRLQILYSIARVVGTFPFLTNVSCSTLYRDKVLTTVRHVSNTALIFLASKYFSGLG